MGSEQGTGYQAEDFQAVRKNLVFHCWFGIQPQTSSGLYRLDGAPNFPCTLNLNQFLSITYKIMKKREIILVYCFLILAGCEKTGNDIKYEGEAVLTSERIKSGDIYLVYGFSFEKGENIAFTFTTTPVPDILVTNITDVENKITGAVLSSPANEEAFCLKGSFSTSADAESFYNSYNEVTDSIFHPLTEEIHKDQVWTIQTSKKTFAKILIGETTIKTSPVSEYIEIKIRYKYQPDGSRSFTGK